MDACRGTEVEDVQTCNSGRVGRGSHLGPLAFIDASISLFASSHYRCHSHSLTQRRLSHPIIFSKANPSKKRSPSPLPAMDNGGAQILSAMDNSGGHISSEWDPYKPVPYICPPNPYDTCMDDPWNEVTTVCSLPCCSPFSLPFSTLFLLVP